MDGGTCAAACGGGVRPRWAPACPTPTEEPDDCFEPDDSFEPDEEPFDPDELVEPDDSSDPADPFEPDVEAVDAESLFAAASAFSGEPDPAAARLSVR